MKYYLLNTNTEVVDNGSGDIKSKCIATDITPPTPYHVIDADGNWIESVDLIKQVNKSKQDELLDAARKHIADLQIIVDSQNNDGSGDEMTPEKKDYWLFGKNIFQNCIK